MNVQVVGSGTDPQGQDPWGFFIGRLALIGFVLG